MAIRTEFKRPEITEEERLRRKRFLAATLVTCAALAMIGGALHVVKLGANRMADMRDRATYDLAEVKQHLRAAGEDILLHDEHQYGKKQAVAYDERTVQALLDPADWKELSRTVLIPAGPFWMGTDRKRAADYDHPRHRVDLPAYRMDVYPVTNAQYARYVVATKVRPPLHWQDGRIPRGEAKRPVTMVSWFNARDYCRWAGKRLPTEAEWEKAARGPDGRYWPWGNTMDSQRLNTYYQVGSTTDVTRYPNGASVYGVMDLAGNVSEWVSDDFDPYPGTDASEDVFRAKIPVARTPEDRSMKVVDLVPVDARYKVLRGGSWKSDPFSTAAYHRNYSWPQYASDFFGFRCAADVATAGGEMTDRQARTPNR